jgi:hypothetical protein
MCRVDREVQFSDKTGRKTPVMLVWETRSVSSKGQWRHTAFRPSSDMDVAERDKSVSM